MSMSIGSASSAISMNWQTSTSQTSRKRPDPSEMADQLFSKLDTSGKGYLEASDLQKAISGLSSTSDSSDSASADTVFSALDADGDGKVTKQEMEDGMTKLADEFESQMHSARMRNAGQSGDMPPPPPPSDSQDQGLTKDQLSSMVSSLDSSDGSSQASDLQNLLASFDKADTDGDGKVTFKEAMAFKKASESSSSTSDSTTTTATTSDTLTTSSAAVFHRIAQLMATYGLDDRSNSASQQIATA
jgi:Ca2+-binding EF-hand superfamily protein